MLYTTAIINHGVTKGTTMLYRIRIFFIIVLLLSQSFAPIKAMQNEKKTASAELVVQNNSSKLVTLLAFNPELKEPLDQHIDHNNRNASRAFLHENRHNAAIRTYNAFIVAALHSNSKYDRNGLMTADVRLSKYEAPETGLPTTGIMTELWLRDIPGTGGKVIATVGQDGSISLTLAPKTP